MKKRKRKIIKDPKARGEWVESVFMARAGEQGLAVSKPWGESNSYDFVVGRPGRFVGVQVKSTTIENGGGYVCVIRKQGKAYARGSFDFVAAYVVPEDVWYIIPANRIRGRECVSLCSKSKQAKNEEYREAWHLLREASEDSEGAISEVAETGDEDSPGAAPVGSQGFPTNALGRLEASMNFFKRQMERK
jgi:PD-(D/E)XK endonuclease